MNLLESLTLRFPQSSKDLKTKWKRKIFCFSKMLPRLKSRILYNGNSLSLSWKSFYTSWYKKTKTSVSGEVLWEL